MANLKVGSKVTIANRLNEKPMKGVVTKIDLDTMWPAAEVKTKRGKFRVALRDVKKNPAENFKNGDRVYLKKEYEDKPGERFIISQCDQERQKCWIGDSKGRGWYAHFSQLTKRKDNPPRRYKGEDSYDGPKYKGKKVVIYNQIESIEAKKGKNSLWPKEKFKHSFKSGSQAEVLGNPDGSILIRSKSGKPLHKLFDY